MPDTSIMVAVIVGLGVLISYLLNKNDRKNEENLRLRHENLKQEITNSQQRMINFILDYNRINHGVNPSWKEIADEMGIEPDSARKAGHRMYKKLKVSNMSDAITIVIENNGNGKGEKTEE